MAETPSTGDSGLGAPPAGVAFHQSGPGGWPPGAPQAIPAARQGLPRGLAFALVASVALVVGGLIGGVIGAGNSSEHSTTATTQLTITETVPPPKPAQLTPDEAAAKVCKALADHYPAVAASNKEKFKFNSSPWDDPGSIAAMNQEHRVYNEFISSMRQALDSGPVPPDLRNAVEDYLVAVRAVDLSDQQKASNKQRSGVNRLYNRLYKKPLELCGI